MIPSRHALTNGTLQRKPYNFKNKGVDALAREKKKQTEF